MIELALKEKNEVAFLMQQNYYKPRKKGHYQCSFESFCLLKDAEMKL